MGRHIIFSTVHIYLSSAVQKFFEVSKDSTSKYYG